MTRWPGPVPRASLAGFGLWFLGGLVFDDVYPFSRVPMYASVATEGLRDAAAIPLFRVAGAEADPQAYTDFVGDDPAFITYEEVCRPYHGCKSYPSSVPRDEWTRLWVSNHLGDPGRPGPVEVEFGFQMVHTGADGLTFGAFEVCWKARAWPR
jgi:hypothetical protein